MSDALAGRLLGLLALCDPPENNFAYLVILNLLFADLNTEQIIEQFFCLMLFAMRVTSAGPL